MGDEYTCVDAYNSSTIPSIPPQKACGEVKTIPVLTWKDMSYDCHLSLYLPSRSSVLLQVSS